MIYYQVFSQYLHLAMEATTALITVDGRSLYAYSKAIFPKVDNMKPVLDHPEPDVEKTCLLVFNQYRHKPAFCIKKLEIKNHTIY